MPVLHLLLVLASFGAHAQCPPSFDAPPSYLYGDLLDLEDFNGDGELDALTAPRDETAVRLSRGRRGVFTRGPLIGIGDSPRDSAAGDFNSDGRLDAIVVGAATASAYFLAGRGDGTFETPRAVATFVDPWSAHADDLDADGKLDLIVANLHDTVDVLWGKGDGTFEAARLAFTPAFYPKELATGDVNHDGRKDLIVAHETGAVTITTMGPGRTHGTPVRVDNDGFVFGMRVFDLDGDGHLDIVTADPSQFVVTFFKGKGDGTFAEKVEFAGGAFTEGLDFGDFNGDGRTDIVAGQSIEGTLIILQGLGNAQFSAPVSHVAGNNVYGVRVADVDHDGDDDVVTFDAGGFSVLVQHAGSGQFRQLETQSIGGLLGPYDVATADFNNDGVPDAVTANALHNTVSVLLGNPNGTLGEPKVFFGGDGSYRVIAADVNGDGNADVVTANLDPAEIGVLHGRGDGTFHAVARYPADAPPQALSHGDVDGDGDQDLLVSALESGKINVFLNAGNGTYTRGIDVAARVPGQTVLADLNRDGKLDLAIADRVAVANVPGALTIRYGNGDGTFGESRDVAVGEMPIDLVAHDFNGDARLDFAVENYNSGTISVLLDDGTGAYRTVNELPVFGAAPHIVVADLNVDGVADIAAANAGLIVIYEGRGNGVFREAIGYRAGNAPFSIAAADFNRDGRMDLVTANLLSHDIAVLKNATACRQRAVRR